MFNFTESLQWFKAKYQAIVDASNLTREELRQLKRSGYVQIESFAPELSFLKSKDKCTPSIQVSQFGLLIDHTELLCCREKLTMHS